MVRCIVSPKEPGAYTELQAECLLSFAESIAFLEGHHFEVHDGFGDGQTRLYLLVADDEAVLYMTTNRGSREVLNRRPVAFEDLLRKEFADCVAQFTSSPQIVADCELSESDLMVDLDRLDGRSTILV